MKKFLRMLLIVMGISLVSISLDSNNSTVSAQAEVVSVDFIPIVAGKKSIHPTFCRLNCSCVDGTGSCTGAPCHVCEDGDIGDPGL